ncbi:DUF7535 family protein [Halorussus caseinilyticus]|uniref:DUF7535 family protein n=1 Tax=Halorussus caseinilyticus TaxID=3034025 RepID=UPI0023E7DFAE|nr:hypothetical protein [Halorussus sp. DT72]
MSAGGSDEADDDAIPAPVKKVARTVTPPYRGRPDTEMTTIGIVYFLGLVVLLIPMLPFIAIVWVISKVTGYFARKAPTEDL